MENNRKSKLSFYLRYTSTTLRLVGLWPVSESPSNPRGGYSYGNLFHFIVIASTMFGQTCQMVTNCWINYTDFESAAESIGPMMGLLTSFVKMCIYRRQREILGRLIGSLYDCLEHGPTEILESFENYVIWASPAISSLLGVTWLVVVGYLGAPVLSDVRKLPFTSWYPWDWENDMIYYCLSYFHEIFLTCCACCIMSTEITFLLSIMYCCARYKVMRTSLETVADDDNHRDDQIGHASNKIGSKLSSIVKLHYEILRDIEDINTAYTYIVMILFFAAVIAICCAGLQITSGSPESTTMTILFLVMALYYAEQLLFYYLPGEILAGQALAVSVSAYMSGWESFEINHRKTIGLMIMRSYIPPKLMAGQFIPLRLENYSAFLTTTASYFTSMRAVADA